MSEIIEKDGVFMTNDISEDVDMSQFEHEEPQLKKHQAITVVLSGDDNIKYVGVLNELQANWTKKVSFWVTPSTVFDILKDFESIDRYELYDGSPSGEPKFSQSLTKRMNYVLNVKQNFGEERALITLSETPLK